MGVKKGALSGQLAGERGRFYTISMNDKEFEKLVAEGVDAIPKKFTDKLDNVAIVIEQEPSEAKREELGMDDGTTLFGLYEGVPLTKRTDYNLVLPDKITIFKKPIMDAAINELEIKELVAETVWHEIAHHFGLDESEVRRRELRRRVRQEEGEGDEE